MNDELSARNGSLKLVIDRPNWPHRFAVRFGSINLLGALVIAVCLTGDSSADDTPSKTRPDEVLDGIRTFFEKTALPDGSFRPGIDPDYQGFSDTAYSDLAAITYAVVLHKTFGWKLPHEAATVDRLLTRQRPDGSFFNVQGSADPKTSQARLYNTTQGVVALRALGLKPYHDPLPVLAAVLKEDYKKLPLYTTSFFPLAFLAAGQPFPGVEDKRIRALMVQADDGYVRDHIASTFHLVHYYRLVNVDTPRAEAIVARVLGDQRPDGSWLLHRPSWDVHAGFDAVFTLTQLGKDRDDCRRAIDKAAAWSLKCRNADGGFGHFPGYNSDIDAIYFQAGTLVMAGFLKPVDPLPKDAHLMAWGHLLPVPEK
jgi:geranylgeranyl transferase type-2 subunit beta